jgi:hypothetical protein
VSSGLVEVTNSNSPYIPGLTVDAPLVVGGTFELVPGGELKVGDYTELDLAVGSTFGAGSTATVDGRFKAQAAVSVAGAFEVRAGSVNIGVAGFAPSSTLELRTGAAVKVAPGGRIDLAGDWSNTSTDGAAFVRQDGAPLGLDVNSKFSMTGTVQNYEAGGGDYGAIGPGYYANFALGDFQVVSGTTTLVDAVANGPAADGTANAVYVDTLRIADGATLSLNGQNIYYHNWDQSAGWGGTLVTGSAAIWAPGLADFDENAAVGLGDFSLFAGKYGTTPGGAGWDADFDLDRNDAVGLGDFSLFAGLYGTTYAYGGPGAPVTGSVPEPATMAFAAVGVLGVLGRRRNRSSTERQ